MKRNFLSFFLILATFGSFSQTFEDPKTDVSVFSKLKTDLGADFAIQYQALNHEASNPSWPLINLGSNFNLPTANFEIITLLAPGITVNLETYLSARHHNEAWVKGGYVIIDNLPFWPSTNHIMKYITVKAGVMHPNIGDQQFRRSDNGNVLNNPFIGNYIMDDFTTNTGVEIMFRNKGFLLLGGINNGTLKPALASTEGSGTSKKYIERNLTDELAYVWKASIDKQISEKFRLRLSLGGSHQKSTLSGTLHNGDRTGSRYYFVMNKQVGDNSEFDVTKNHTSGNWGPGAFTKDNTININLFAKYSKLEFFGTLEKANGITASSSARYDFSQLATELVYRLGKQEQWFIGGRYNKVTNAETSPKMEVDRIQFSTGWYMIRNMLMKLEYVDQQYKNFSSYGNKAGFKGFILEAGISF